MNKNTILQNKYIDQHAFTYDDVLLLPGLAKFKRQEVDLTTFLHPKIKLFLPVVSSPMDTVTEFEMAKSMAVAGGLGIIHRNLSVETEANIVKKIKQIKGVTGSAVDNEGHLLVGAAVGIGSDFEERTEALIKVGVDVLVIDSGHGFTSFMVDAIKKIKNKYPNQIVMGGNVATFEGAEVLIKAGADILRVGMGPGSICTTRVVTGMGVPQLFAVAEVVRAVSGTNVSVVADGGIKQVGDMAKALAFGADAVMLGGLLARFDESPGKVTEINGKKYKGYRGMGSIAAMKKGGAERYGQSKDTKDKQLIAEGVEGLVPYQGSVSDYLTQVSGSLKSSFYYIGGKNIEEFFTKSRAIVITQASLTESHPHSVVIKNTGGNYNIK